MLVPLPAAIITPTAGGGMKSAKKSNNSSGGGGGGILCFASRNDSNSTTTKGNDGRSYFRRRMVCIKVVVWVGLILMAYNLLWTYWLAGVNIPDEEYDKVSGQKRIRRKPGLMTKHDYVTNKDVPTTPIDGILEGYLTLIDIELPDAKAGGLVSAGNNNELTPYEEVQGVFCHISWDLQRNDPTSVPLFQDLQRQSTLCEATMFTADLRDVTEKARAYDNGEKLNFAATRPKHATQSIDPAAVIFSESKSGSVLISNVLAAFRPERTRVYTEAPPVTSALLACRQLESQQAMIQNEQGAKTKDEFCPGPAHHALIRDVFYLLGRNANPVKPQYVFYKINSLATTVIQDFVHAIPNANWVFSYRDPVEVLMSHFQHYLRNEPMPKNHMPTCLQNYGQTRQSELFEELVRQKDRTVASLTKVEFCAVHLATLCHAAVEEYKRTNNAKHKRTSNTNAAYWFIDHKELPYAVWEQILSKVANVHLTHDQVDHMQAVAKVHTKGSGSTQKVWKEDSIFKQSKAPPEVQEAANIWLYPIYRSMDKIRQDLEQKFSSGRT